MTDTVYDFSAAHLTDLPGAVGAMLYVGTPGRPKNAIPSQVATLLARGFQVGGVFENNTLDWAQGRGGGRQFAQAFDADATNCGLPGRPGAFTADNPAANPGQFVEMLRGAGDVLGVERVTAYGYLPHLTAARNAGVATRFWLTGHCLQPMPPWINLYQHNGSQPAEWGPATSTVGGITVNHNTVLGADWGQHPSPQESDMTPDQEKKLDQIIGYFNQSATSPGGQTVYDAIWEVRDLVRAVPPGQFDAAAVAAELAAHGGLLTAQQFLDILSKVGLRVTS